MATLLGSVPCTSSYTSPKPARNHNFQRPRCPAPFQAHRHTHKHASNRASRLAVHAAAATEQNVKMPSWEQMHKQLTTQHKLESVSPTDAKKLVDSGKFVLVDVRPPDIYAKAHPEGAQSAPLFQSVNWAKPDFKKYLRAVAFMANGVTPVEENTEFLDDIRKASNGKGVILMCEAGGTTKPSPNFAAGKASRSLKAAWKALKSGDMPVKHMAGGVYGWYTAELPFYGIYDKSNLGRTPNAAVEPKGQYYEEAQVRPIDKLPDLVRCLEPWRKVEYKSKATGYDATK